MTENDAPPGYDAAVGSAALFDRSYRTRLSVKGRAPRQMLDGILTGTIPPEPERPSDEVLAGRATYHCVLTPKGKMVADLWVWCLGAEDAEGFLLDVPAPARDGLLAHFRTFLPPRLAGVEDLTQGTRMLTVVGPDAAAALSRAALGLRVEAPELQGLEEGEFRAVGAGAADALLVTRTAQVWPQAFDVVGPASAVDALERALVGAGVVAGDPAAWEVLRVEAGRPAYGVDMDEDRIPVEAGVHDRAIDYQKGCYTGQEVIVRIRDRGRVNRSLRLLHLGGVEPPAPGAELFDPDSERPEKAVGWVTSAVRSPRFGETVALGYVRREADRAVPAAPG